MHMKNKLPVICLMGPTCAGKTELAMRLADNAPVRLISVDSVLIYRGMDIGSAKPTAKELQQYPHDLIDIVDVNDRYSVYDFCQQANALIEQSHRAGIPPVFLGGTMMYFHALQNGLANMPSRDPDIHNKLSTQLAEHGVTAMHEQLQQIDPSSAAKINPNDPQRTLLPAAVRELPLPNERPLCN